MKKPIKITLILLGVLIALPLIGISIALLVINPNDYKPQIESLVKEQTGRDFTIQDDLKLSVFPWLGIEIGKMSLGNASGFSPAAFAQIQSAEVKVHLLPLLRKEVEVSAITLSGLELNLAKNKTGVTNWDDLNKTATPSDGTTPDTATSPQQETSQTNNKAGIAALAIGGLSIKNATLNWLDETTDTRHSIQGLNLTTGALSLGKPVDLSLDFAIVTNQPPLDAKIQLSANIDADLNNNKHRVNNTKLHITFNAKEPAASGEITLSTDVIADMEKQHIELPQLLIEVLINEQASGLKANTKLSSQIGYSLDKEQLTLKQTTINLHATGTDLPADGVKLHSSSDISVDLKAQTLAIENLLIAIADQVKANASISGTHIIDKPNLVGSFGIANFNPRQLLAALGQAVPETQSDQVLNSADLSMKFEYKPGHAKIHDLVVHLDKSTLNSQLKVSNFDQPKVDFKLDLDHFNVDDYLPPKKEETTATATTTPAATEAAPKEPLDLAPLRALNLNGQINVGKLTASNVKVSDIAITVKANDGLINITPLKAKLYEGQYSGNIQLNAKGDKLITSVNESLSGIQAGPLLKDLIDNDMLEGKGDLKLKLTTTGVDVEEIMQSLAGKVELLFKDGAVNGFNLGKMLRDARSRLQGEKIDKTAISKTDFAELSASLDLKDGVAHNSDLHMKSPFLRVTGKGDVNYVSQQLNYVANVTVVGTSKGQDGKEVTDLKGIPLDVKVKGPFSDPKIDIDLAAALEAEAKAKAKEKVDAAKAKVKEEVQQSKEKIKDEAKDKVKDELNDKLKKLF